MIGTDNILKEIEFAEFNRMSIRKFYKEINQAVERNDSQAIWQLSKIITRHSLR